ncbi:murein biosynthesis integral membrane protein MurJ [Luteipulveratus flavus]|uniref:Murein biosynthesis integral membrane protein MurJ n=1 Tax=Luteipulveratus flavus TaxID=3031728 RepID=A0ABT6C6A0_9MICO|nr:murein biosynthesis integral membrane protein MurJ [Luteipulveratus sp. YIM 133296]MDF8263867.1 murein biosynthesis integral membrane protein MurJ [Luteipulveratus sp. YIM 133296]
MTDGTPVPDRGGKRPRPEEESRRRRAGDRPSLGEMYAREVNRPAVLPDMLGSIGDQYTSWIAEDAAERERNPWDGNVAYDDGHPGGAGFDELRDDPTTFMPSRKALREVKEGYTRPDSLSPADAEISVPIPVPRPAERPALEDLPPEDVTRADLRRAQDPEPEAPAAPRPSTSTATLGRASALMAAGTLVSRVLGMLRASLQVAAIGTGLSANVWSTANTLPNIIYLLLAGGVINAVLVPQITKSLRHADGGKAYTDRLLTLAMTLLVGVTVVFVAAAPIVYRLYDSSASGARLELGTTFALICLPQILFYGLYALFGQVLNARGRFGWFMWSPALANVIAIAGLVAFLASTDGFGRDGPTPEVWDSSMVWMLAGSATLGIVVQAVCLIIPLWRDGYRYSPSFQWRGVGLGSASKVAMWAFAAVILQQIGLLITTNVLNTQGNNDPGKNAQEQGFLLFMLPHSLVTVSLVTALFTAMARAANVRNHALVRRDLRQGLRLTAVATVPCTVGAFVLGYPLVGTLFGQEQQWKIGSFMIPMMLGLSAFGLCVLVQRVFYAYEDARTPFRMQVWCTAVAAVITLGCLFIPDHYVGIGIGLSLTISNLVQGLLGFRWLQKTVGRVMIHDVVRTYVRLLVASLFAAAVTLPLVIGVDVVLDGRLESMVALVLGSPLFLLVYVYLSRRLHVREIDDLVNPITRRLGRLARR